MITARVAETTIPMHTGNRTMNTAHTISTRRASGTSFLHLAAALVVTASSTAVAQEPWVRQSPLPYPPLDTLTMAFPTPMHGYLAGDRIVFGTETGDFLLETHDGGHTWTHLDPPGFQLDIRCVFFLDELHGWVVGSTGPGTNDNFRTVDGGVTWQAMTLPCCSWSIVRFLDPNFGWIDSVGSMGPIALSTDGGDSWTLPIVMVDNNAELLFTVSFANVQLGIATNDSGVFRTTDGGVSWTQVLSGDFHAPQFLSESVLLLPVSPTGMLRSTDGGATWSPVATPGSGYFGIEVFTADIAIAMKSDGEVIRTTDAGATWTEVDFPEPFIDPFAGIEIINETTAIRVRSSTGNISVTADAGATWTTGVNSPPIPTSAVAFGSPTDGVVACLDGLILGTNDGGASWEYRSNGQARDLHSIAMFDAQRGLAVGEFGTVLRTSNGGELWTPSRPTLGDLNDIYLIDDQTAVAVGDIGRVIKTIDGGQTWSSIMIANGQFDLVDVEFADENVGWAIAGPEANIFHTVDGGATWLSQFFNGGFPLSSISFVDAEHGWAAGPSDAILWTADGGVSWTVASIFDPQGGPDVKWDISFVNHSVGWVVGNFGYIAKSTDGGLTWVNHDIAATEHIMSIHVANEQELWVATLNGHIHHSIDGGVTWTQLITGFESDPALSFDFVTATPSGDLWAVGALGTVLKMPTASTPGDVDGDGIVGILDFLALLAAWGPCPGSCPPACPADLDGDCTVGILDFLIVLANWG